jgi:hypothetical protein
MDSPYRNSLHTDSWRTGCVQNASALGQMPAQARRPKRRRLAISTRHTSFAQRIWDVLGRALRSTFYRSLAPLPKPLTTRCRMQQYAKQWRCQELEGIEVDPGSARLTAARSRFFTAITKRGSSSGRRARLDAPCGGHIICQAGKTAATSGSTGMTETSAFFSLLPDRRCQIASRIALRQRHRPCFTHQAQRLCNIAGRDWPRRNLIAHRNATERRRL